MRHETQCACRRTRCLSRCTSCRWCWTQCPGPTEGLQVVMDAVLAPRKADRWSHGRHASRFEPLSSTNGLDARRRQMQCEAPRIEVEARSDGVLGATTSAEVVTRSMQARTTRVLCTNEDTGSWIPFAECRPC